MPCSAGLRDQGPIVPASALPETRPERPAAQMNPLSLSNGALYLEAVPLEAVAQQFGTPCYVYSRAALEGAWREFVAGCAGRDVLVCYAVKANSNLAILNLFSRLGAGFDIVSGGELARVIAAGGSAAKTVFSGVGKTEAEMRTALAAGILCFNVESEAEIERLDRGTRYRVHGPRVAARQSGCRSQNPSVYRHRSEAKQIRDHLRRRLCAISQSSNASQRADGRHRPAHRLADHRNGAVRFRPRKGDRVR
jgi:hypothetical protein